MITAGAFVLAAATGALVRTGLGQRLNAHDGFPLGTLVANLAGAFALGALHDVAGPAATVLGTGLVGTLTTFSSFTRDVVALWATRRGLTVTYVAVTVAGALLAAAAGAATA